MLLNLEPNSVSPKLPKYIFISNRVGLISLLYTLLANVRHLKGSDGDKIYEQIETCLYTSSNSAETHPMLCYT